ncbi:MAG: hypothetical protein EOO06_12895 [Chitinophagaceae bacterium]|nr:MAG: hypothetical protein EOO06_12895 [Chitinophagaceae bacterium]
MLRKLTLLILCAALFLCEAGAQDISTQLQEVTIKSSELINRAEYDSAILLLTQAESKIEINSAGKLVSASLIYSLLGEAWQGKKDVQKAHLYFTRALNNAIEHQHTAEGPAALGMLNTLHRKIREQDLPFLYPAVKETELSTRDRAFNCDVCRGCSETVSPRLC